MKEILEYFSKLNIQVKVLIIPIVILTLFWFSSLVLFNYDFVENKNIFYVLAISTTLSIANFLGYFIPILLIASDEKYDNESEFLLSSIISTVISIFTLSVFMIYKNEKIIVNYKYLIENVWECIIINFIVLLSGKLTKTIYGKIKNKLNSRKKKS